MTAWISAVGHDYGLFPLLINERSVAFQHVKHTQSGFTLFTQLVQHTSTTKNKVSFLFATFSFLVFAFHWLIFSYFLSLYDCVNQKGKSANNPILFSFWFNKSSHLLFLCRFWRCTWSLRPLGGPQATRSASIRNKQSFTGNQLWSDRITCQNHWLDKVIMKWVFVYKFIVRIFFPLPEILSPTPSSMMLFLKWPYNARLLLRGPPIEMHCQKYTFVHLSLNRAIVFFSVNTFSSLCSAVS